MEILIYIIKSSAILTLFYIVYFTVLKKDTFFSSNRHFLIIGVIVSLLLPLLIFTKTTFVDIPDSSALFVTEINPTTNTIQQETNFILDWWKFGLIIYFIGVILLSIRFLKQFFSLLKLLNRFPSEKLGGYTYIRTNKNITPFSFFKYIVYNPNLHLPEELKMIISHEQAHASQWHSIDILIANLMLVFQWMNPFAWLYKKGIEENLEFIADNETAHQVISKKAYQLTLVKVLSTSLQPALTNKFYQSLIKKRIIMLHKTTSKTQNKWKFALILPLLAVFLWSFNVKEVVEYKKAYTNNTVNLVSTQTNSELISNNQFFDKNNALIEKHRNEEGSKLAFVSTKKEIKNVANEITMTIDKNTSDAELKKIKNIFKDNYDVTVKFSDVERNRSGEITSIKVDVKSKSSNSNFNIKDEDGISSFQIYYNDKTGELRLGSTGRHNLHFVSKYGNKYFYEIDDDHNTIHTWNSYKGKNHKNTFYKYINDDDEDGEDVEIIFFGDSLHLDDNHNFFFISDGEGRNHIKMKLHKGKGDKLFFIDTEDGKDPLIIIDGKKASIKKMDEIDSDSVIQIEYLKGDKAIEKYGKKAKDGVILITTKKN